MKTIIFDFNGTVMDDVDICVDCFNTIASRYEVATVDIEKYRNVFTFPVKNYYEKVGFDFQKISFEELSEEWSILYDEHASQYKIMDGFTDIYIKINQLAYRMVLISASRHDKLLAQCRLLKIDNYFDEILGINDIYATSKLALAQSYCEKDHNDILFIGDTVHDYEVASTLGYPCILVDRGHQSYAVLKTTNAEIYHNLREVPLCE